MIMSECFTNEKYSEQCWQTEISYNRTCLAHTLSKSKVLVLENAYIHIHTSSFKTSIHTSSPKTSSSIGQSSKNICILFPQLFRLKAMKCKESPSSSMKRKEASSSSTQSTKRSASDNAKALRALGKESYVSQSGLQSVLADVKKMACQNRFREPHSIGLGKAQLKLQQIMAPCSR